MKKIFTFSLLVSFGISAFAATPITLPLFDDQGIKKWKEKTFSGETFYQIATVDNMEVLRAVSQNGASGLFIEQRIDLAKTPFINWRWKIQNRLSGLQEKNKSGDDYVARIYLVIKKGWLGLNSQVMNYVWSSNNRQGNIWNNAYVGEKVKMLAVRDKDAKLNTWYDEKRNVYQDFIHYFGDKGSAKANLNAYRYIDVIALMTDTDDSAKKAESFYGNISFTAQ